MNTLRLICVCTSLPFFTGSVCVCGGGGGGAGGSSDVLGAVND